MYGLRVIDSSIDRNGQISHDARFFVYFFLQIKKKELKTLRTAQITRKCIFLVVLVIIIIIVGEPINS